MNREEFNKAVNSFKKIGLSTEEKQAMLGRIMAENSVSAPVKKPVKSPFKIAQPFYSFGAWANRNRRLSVVIAVVLIISLGSSSVAFAAEGSLPGDTLYPVKINVIEPIQTDLAPTPEAKAQLAASFAAERVQEGETLATQDRLDAANQAELSELITAHTEALDADLLAMASSDPRDANTISTTFQTQMNTYAETLDDLVPASTSTDQTASSSPTSQGYFGHFGGRSGNQPQNQVGGQATSTNYTRGQGNDNNNNNNDGHYFGQQFGQQNGNGNQNPSPSASGGTATSGNTSSDTSDNNFGGNSNNDNNSNNNSGNNSDNNNHWHNDERNSILNLAASAQASGNQVSSWSNQGSSNDNSAGNDGGGKNNSNKQVDMRHQ